MAIDNITGYCTKASELQGLCEVSGSFSIGMQELITTDVITGFVFLGAVVFMVALGLAVANRK